MFISNPIFLSEFGFVFSELHDQVAWTAMGFARNFQNFMVVNDVMERIDVNDVSKEQFIELYEKPYKPVVITGVQNNWSARQKWTLHVRFYYKISL